MVSLFGELGTWDVTLCVKGEMCNTDNKHLKHFLQPKLKTVETLESPWVLVLASGKKNPFPSLLCARFATVTSAGLLSLTTTAYAHSLHHYPNILHTNTTHIISQRYLVIKQSNPTVN